MDEVVWNNNANSIQNDVKYSEINVGHTNQTKTMYCNREEAQNALCGDDGQGRSQPSKQRLRSLDAAWTKWEVESLQHGIPNTGPTETLIVREEALPLLGAQPKRALGPATNAENQLLSCRRTSRSSRLQDITHHLRTIDRIYPDSINKPQTMPTCKPIWTWKTIGYIDRVCPGHGPREESLSATFAA